MYKLTSIIMTVMLFFGNWFGLADKLDINPAEIEFNSKNLIEEAEINVSSNSVLKWTLTDASSLTYWSTGKENGEYIEIIFSAPTEINTVVLREVSDNVDWFKIYVMNNGEYDCIYEQDRIMTYRLCDIDNVTTDKIKIEFSKIRGKVKLGGIEIYNEDRSGSQLRVSDYLTINEWTLPFIDAEGFGDYFDLITDLIVFQTVNIDKDGNIVINAGEATFDEYINKIKTAIGDRDVKLWCTVLFQLSSDDPEIDDNDYRMNFINNKLDTIITNLKEFTSKYGFDGIDYDWEHPTEKDQFKAYDRLIIETSKFTKVSVASTTWQFRFSDEAIAVIDHFNIMTYDMFDERGDHSNIYNCGRVAIDKYIGFGVPKDKIFLGIPAYGRPVNSAGYWPGYASYPELGKFGNVVEDMTYSADGVNEETQDVYFNSFTAAKDKTALSIQSGCGGVMVFNMNSDLPFNNKNSIHRAIYEAKY